MQGQLIKSVVLLDVPLQAPHYIPAVTFVQVFKHLS